VDAATGMHEDAAAWERMGEAFGVARRMVEVEGRETGHRRPGDWRRSAKSCAQHRSYRAQAVEDCWRPSFAVEGSSESDESRSVSVALYLTNSPVLAPQPGLAARCYQRTVLDYCLEHVVVLTGGMGRDGASSTGRRCRQRGVAVVAVARLAGSLDTLASSAGGSSQGRLADVGRVVGDP
jgi:hypothetical protein